MGLLHASWGANEAGPQSKYGDFFSWVQASCTGQGFLYICTQFLSSNSGKSRTFRLDFGQLERCPACAKHGTIKRAADVGP